MLTCKRSLLDRLLKFRHQLTRLTRGVNLDLSQRPYIWDRWVPKLASIFLKRTLAEILISIGLLNMTICIVTRSDLEHKNGTCFVLCNNWMIIADCVIFNLRQHLHFIYVHVAAIVIIVLARVLGYFFNMWTWPASQCEFIMADLLVLKMWHILLIQMVCIDGRWLETDLWNSLVLLMMKLSSKAAFAYRIFRLVKVVWVLLYSYFRPKLILDFTKFDLFILAQTNCRLRALRC